MKKIFLICVLCVLYLNVFGAVENIITATATVTSANPDITLSSSSWSGFSPIYGQSISGSGVTTMTLTPDGGTSQTDRVTMSTTGGSWNSLTTLNVSAADGTSTTNSTLTLPSSGNVTGYQVTTSSEKTIQWTFSFPSAQTIGSLNAISGIVTFTATIIT